MDSSLFWTFAIIILYVFLKQDIKSLIKQNWEQYEMIKNSEKIINELNYKIKI